MAEQDQWSWYCEREITAEALHPQQQEPCKTVDLMIVFGIISIIGCIGLMYRQEPNGALYFFGLACFDFFLAGFNYHHSKAGEPNGGS